MDRFPTKSCSVKQYRVMNRNLFRVISHNGCWLRIRQPSGGVNLGPTEHWSAPQKLVQVV
jgi:hypothetical protein